MGTLVDVIGLSSPGGCIVGAHHKADIHVVLGEVDILHSPNFYLHQPYINIYKPYIPGSA